MAKLLYFLNTKNQTYFTKYCQYLSSIDVGQTDYNGHVLVNVLHTNVIDDKIYSMSFKDFSTFCEKQRELFLKRARYKNFKRNLKEAISKKLIRLARRISK